MLVKKFEVTKIRTLFWFFSFWFFRFGFWELFSPSDLIWLPDVINKTKQNLLGEKNDVLSALSTGRKKYALSVLSTGRKNDVLSALSTGRKSDTMSGLSTGRKSDTMQDRQFLTFFKAFFLI